MTDTQDIIKYVIDHIDEAVEREDIKIYYQPVFRTLTRKICEKEALARWDDPVNGLMMPEQFIPVLEEHKLIHRLDTFMIRKVCSHYAHCVDRHEPVIPISFNLSWLDFELCDIIGILNRETENNQVPREMIRIEINETLVAHDRELIRNKLSILHDLGYRIIMDDFGSGHSSVNLLRDYVFDEIKIDMHALWDNGERAGKIIEHLCSMSKALGISPVAERVESEEQYRFLRRMGIGKMQGYYFVKPMFYWDLVDHVRKKGLSLEPLNLKDYYDRIGRKDIRSKHDIPYSIAEFDNGVISFLYANEAYRKTVESLGIQDFQTLEDIWNDPGAVVNAKFNDLLSRAKKKGGHQVIDMIWNGCYCIISVDYLTGAKGRDAVEIVLNNISLNPRVTHIENLNNALDSVCSVFNRVVRFDLEADRVDILHMETPFTEDYGNNVYSENIERYINKEIYPEDRERYRQFAHFGSLGERIRNSGRNFITGCFRFKNTNGNYIWMEQYIILSRKSGDSGSFIICTKDVDEKQIALLMQLSSFISVSDNDEFSGTPAEISDTTLWRSAVEVCPVGLFWKDRNRRFLGVNRVFLEYYGFESADEVIGKTDEDLNWHVDPGPFRRDEERILNNGDIIRDVIGTCICRGINRDIIVNKAPIHRDGKIVGLIGYFHDVTDEAEKDESLKGITLKDPVTGVLNTMGLMDSTIRYSESYEDNHADFVMVAFNIKRYDNIRKEFGAEYSDMMMRAVAEKIQKIVGVSGITSRPVRNLFVIIRKVDRPDEGQTIMQVVSNEIRSIREVNGTPCTIYTSAGYAAYSEFHNGEALYSAAVKRMNDQMERMRGFTGGY